MIGKATETLRCCHISFGSPANAIIMGVKTSTPIVLPAHQINQVEKADPKGIVWVKTKIKKQNKHELKNGILYLKGGDLTEELKDFPKATEYNISDFFEDEFFETKKVVHLPLKFVV